MGLPRDVFLDPRDIKLSHFRTGLDAMIGILALVRLAVSAALSPGHATLAVVDPPFRFGGASRIENLIQRRGK